MKTFGKLILLWIIAGIISTGVQITVALVSDFEIILNVEIAVIISLVLFIAGLPIIFQKRK